MKKIITAVFLLLVVGAAYMAGTFNASQTINVPPAAWAGDSKSAQAWRELVTSMEAAGASVFEATEDESDRLDGLVYLAQIASAALEMKLAKGDTANPQFTDWMGDYRKFLGDSPDAVYHTAQISAEHSYEIKGNIGDAGYLGFMLYGKGLNGWNRAAANISSEALRFDEQGNFHIVLSRSQPADTTADWLALEDDIHMVMVRQYFHDRPASQEASFSISNLSPPAWTPPGDQQVASALREATTFFNETLAGSIALSGMLSASPNTEDVPASYSPDFGGVFYPTFDNQYFGSWFYLEDDEALVIEGDVPDVAYWSISLQNRWMQSLDYQHYPVTLNNRQIKTGQGSYRVVIAHQNPDTGNWISTAGKREGLLSIRYQLSTDTASPTIRLVKFDAL